MTVDAPFPWQAEPVIRHVQRLLDSFRHWTGYSLLDSSNQPASNQPEIVTQALFTAPFVVVSHGIEADPIFNYGNQVALDLWELGWHQFIQTPSRRTAEPTEQADRNVLLQQAKEQGLICNYQGVRISSTGKRFRIQNVLLWDVLDETGNRCGQAATFDRWEML
ncbi:MAG: MEKHLA domain-containing protein [Leptolyngbyaceae cyanobacterium bins.302]|nr:MEKHLA domain-containing protein [Leptolyngbyaceae cyanobacterium bins.302]